MFRIFGEGKVMIGRKKLFLTAAVLTSCMLFVCPAQAQETESNAAETETEAQTEEVYEEAKVMFTLDTLRVREAPDQESETIAFCELGESVSVLGKIGEWYHVRTDDPYREEDTQTDAAEGTQTDTSEGTDPDAPAPEDIKEGYIAESLLTEVKDEMDHMIEVNEVQKQMNEAAAAAAAAAASAPSGGGKTVVSRKKIPNCIGDGGTIVITYSDGSKSKKKY